MNFLTPLYLLGALAVAAPILLHLIRQTPRGELPFSSIMFLEPSPPKVTQRSRIDNWLLLLLRAAALALLALAFARPFWRAVAQMDLGDAEQRRVLILVDTSASLRRGDLWTEVQKRAETTLAAVRPGDPLAVFAFDTTPRAILSFAESAKLDPPARLALARGRLATLRPTWKATNLGAALAEAVAAIADGADRDAKISRVPRRIVLISDLQSGSQLEALGALAWPSDVELELQTVNLSAGNAGIEALADAPTTGPETTTAGPTPGSPMARVRVSNDIESKSEAFQVGWVDPKTKKLVAPIAAYVPPGESRVVRVPMPPGNLQITAGSTASSTLQLIGDAFPFDNSAFVAVAPPTKDEIDFFGPDESDDPNGLLYYLNRVFESTPRRTIRLGVNPTDPKRTANLIIVASELAPDRATQVRRQVEAGSTALIVARREGASPTLATLLGLPNAEWAEAPAGRDALLGEIAFDHPAFAPLAGPQFNDFTKIRFWKHRRSTDPAATFAGAQILARFDDGAPALVEKTVGQGRIVVLASGWSPGDSQLARSSKFVPLMTSLLDRRGAASEDAKQYRVGDRGPLSDLGLELAARPVEITRPDGTTERMEAGVAAVAATDTPGVYSARVVGREGGSPRTFAVNLDPGESRTTPLTSEAFEQLKIRLAGGTQRARLDAEALRQMKTVELEGRQKLWRWIVLGVIALLIGETWLAGRVDRGRLPRPAANSGTVLP